MRPPLILQRLVGCTSGGPRTVARAPVLDISLWLEQRIAHHQGESPQALDIHAPCPPPALWRTAHVDMTRTSVCLLMSLALAIMN